MNRSIESGVTSTNTIANSVAKAQHSEPSVRLLGRVAAAVLGYAGYFGSGGKPHLHLVLLISDAYNGTLGFDGQPTYDIDFRSGQNGSAFAKFMLIKTTVYVNEIPANTVLEIEIDPPAGMSKTLFAQKLAEKACNFASYALDYSLPEQLRQPVMIPGEFNSSSYMAGLLNSVMGYVPAIKTPGYQTPGWDSPIPVSYFKGEAIR